MISRAFVLLLLCPLTQSLMCHYFAHNIVGLNETNTDTNVNCTGSYCAKMIGNQKYNGATQTFLFRGCNSHLFGLDNYGHVNCTSAGQLTIGQAGGTTGTLYCCDTAYCNPAAPSFAPSFIVAAMSVALATVFSAL